MFNPKTIPSPLTLGVLFLLTILPWCGIATIGGSSEAREAHVVSSILQNDNWILPLRNGVVPSKPPLFHWIAAQAAQLRGGATPGVMRAVSALFAALTLILTASLAARWTLAHEGTHSSAQAARAAFVSVVVLSLSYGFLSLAIDARVDMTLCFFIVASLYFPLRSIATPLLPNGGNLPVAPDTRALRYFWLCCGAAVLAKGPLGMVLPLSILTAIMIDLFGLGRGLRLALYQPRGWLYCCAVALPWYLFAINQGGSAFIERQLIFENVQRFTGGDFVNKEKWWFYLPSFLSTCAPWSLIVLLSGLNALKSRKNRALGLRQNPYIRCTMLWIIVPVVLLSAASGKRHSYLLPLLPAVALLCSQIRVSAQLKLRYQKVFLRLSKCICATLCLSAISFSAFELPNFRSNAALFAAQAFLTSQANYAALLFSTAALLLLFYWNHPRPTLSWLACLTLVVGWLSIGIGIKNHLKGFDRIAAAINRNVAANEKIYLPKHPRDEFFDPLLYYLSREVTLVSEESDPCSISGAIISHRSWVDHLPQSQKDCLQQSFSARTIPDQQKVLSDREIVLLARQF